MRVSLDMVILWISKVHSKIGSGKRGAFKFDVRDATGL